jgi:hypothetical protein
MPRINALKTLAIAAALVATIIPAKAEYKVGDIVRFNNPQQQKTSEIGCTAFVDADKFLTYWTQQAYAASRAYGPGYSAYAPAYFGVREAIKQEWIGKVAALREPGRFCTPLNTQVEYRIVAKNYSDGGFKQLKPEAFLCVTHPVSGDLPCLWVRIQER